MITYSSKSADDTVGGTLGVTSDMALRGGPNRTPLQAHVRASGGKRPGSSYATYSPHRATASPLQLVTPTHALRVAPERRSINSADITAEDTGCAERHRGQGSRVRGHPGRMAPLGRQYGEAAEAASSKQRQKQKQQHSDR